MKHLLIVGLLLLGVKECNAQTQKTVDLSAATTDDLKEVRRQIYRKYSTSGEVISTDDADILSRSETALKKNPKGTVSFSKMPTTFYYEQLKVNSYIVGNYLREKDKITEFIRLLKIAQKADTTIISRLIADNPHFNVNQIAKKQLEDLIK